MEFEDINGIIWEHLARSGKELTINDIVAGTGVVIVPAQISLKKMIDASLVRLKVSKAGERRYLANVELDSLSWAQGVCLGISVYILEELAGLSVEEKEEALRIATDGVIEKIESDSIKKRIEKRNRVIKGRAASKAASSEIAQIVVDTKNAICSGIKVETDRDKKVVELLEKANREAERALELLTERLKG